MAPNLFKKQIFPLLEQIYRRITNENHVVKGAFCACWHERYVGELHGILTKQIPSCGHAVHVLLIFY